MLSYEFPPLGGGTGNACRHLLEQFLEYPGLSVDLITSGAGNRLEIEALGDSIRIHRVPVRKNSVHFWTMRELAQWTWRAWKLSHRLALQREFDLCHCWSGWPPGWIGYSLNRRLPYLVALRGSDVPGYNSRLRVLDPLVFRHLSRRVWRRASAVTAVSKHLKSLARNTDRDVPIDVIGNGVDTAFFVPGASDDPASILFVGRLIDRKGLNFLLRAFRELSAAHPKCRLVIAGDGPEKGQLEAYCLAAGLDGRVRFTGVLSHDELRLEYQRAHLFVLPSIQEGMSNAVLEAMASGLPIVMTDSGGSEAICDNGVIVEPGSADALRDALGRYLTDRDLLRRHGKASRVAAEQMSWQRAADSYVELYRRVLERSSSTED
jgi:glycosyltransferase involved in cell wall biosynthesis